MWTHKTKCGHTKHKVFLTHGKIMIKINGGNGRNDTPIIILVKNIKDEKCIYTDIKIILVTDHNHDNMPIS